MADRKTWLTNNSSPKSGNREGISMPSPLSFGVSCIEGRPRVCLVSIPCLHAKDTGHLLVGPKSFCGWVETDPHILWRHEALTVNFQRSGELMSSDAEVKWTGSHAFQTSLQVRLIVVQERLTSSPVLQNKLIFPSATTQIFKK